LVVLTYGATAGGNVAAGIELVEFVRDALARGNTRAEIEQVLVRAGWSRELIDSALRAYADVEFPIPVPKPKSYLSAREAFFHLLLFTSPLERSRPAREHVSSCACRTTNR
jgi:hypothetical protein